MTRPAKRIKIDRKALRAPDEFQTTTARVADWIAANRALAIGGAGAGLLLAATVLGWGWYDSRREAIAAIRFRAARTQLEAEQFSPAAESFSEIERTYGRTAFGGLAALYRAHALLRGGRTDDAVEAYEVYLEGSPAAQYLRQSALNGLAAALEGKGDVGAALERYKEAAALDGPFRIEAKLSAARLTEKSDPTAAEKLYGEALSEEAVQLDPGLRSFVESKAPPVPPSADS